MDDGRVWGAGDDGKGDGAVTGFDVGEDGGDRQDVVHLLEVELFLAIGDGVRVEGVAEPFVEDFDGAGEGDAAEGVEEVFGEATALLADGGLPSDEMDGHGVGDGAVEVEEVGLEVAWGQRQGCGGDGRHGFRIAGLVHFEV